MHSSPRRAQLCSAEYANRVANRMFDDARQDVSVIRTAEPLQPIRVMRSIDVVDRSAEIIVVTA